VYARELIYIYIYSFLKFVFSSHTSKSISYQTIWAYFCFLFFAFVGSLTCCGKHRFRICQNDHVENIWT
jgi:hypothetical protein